MAGNGEYLDGKRTYPDRIAVMDHVGLIIADQMVDGKNFGVVDFFQRAQAVHVIDVVVGHQNPAHRVFIFFDERQ